jgi:hypothetical protein
MVTGRAFLLAWLAVGCAGQQPKNQETAEHASPSERASPSNLPSARKAITELVGDAPCSSSAVCRTIPFGAKPCGGPRQHLVYSTAATDSARLAREVARYNESDAQANRTRGLVSDCSVTVQPKVSCVSGRCAAVKSELRQVY